MKNLIFTLLSYMSAFFVQLACFLHKLRIFAAPYFGHDAFRLCIMQYT